MVVRNRVFATILITPPKTPEKPGFFGFDANPDKSIYFRSKLWESRGRICDDSGVESKEFGISWAREGWR